MANSPVRAALRRLAAAGCAIAVLAGLSGCGGSDSAAADGRPVVLTTFTVLADIARNVAGEHLRVESITRVGAEVHGYEPTPEDARRAAEADLILDNGLGLEAWFERFLSGAAGGGTPRAVASEGVEPIPIEGADGAANPHAWMSPLNAEVYVGNIVTAFSELDPVRADAYAANGAAYTEELRAVHDELTARLSELPERQRALVTCEGAFSYLARDAGLRESYIWPVNAEQQATPQRVAAAIAFVRDNEVPAVFCESTVSDDAMQQVVRESGAAFGGVLYVDSLSEADGPVPTYLDLLRHDTELIADALAGAAA